MYYAILQRWPGEDSDTICMEYPFDKKDECERMIENLRKSAYKKKHPVKYRMIELDGEMEYSGKEQDEFRKKNNVDRIIISNGTIKEDIPTFIQKDLRG